MAMKIPSHRELKERQRNERNDWTDSFRLRTQRALSWLKRAENEAHDPDACFTFLWISFNAAYGRFIEGAQETNERQKYEEFIQILLASDRTKRIESLLFGSLSESMERLIANKYVQFDYWHHRMFPELNRDWEKSLNSEINSASYHQRKGKSHPYLMIVLSRLQVLRNQIMHGASTWDSMTNRGQVQDAAEFMRQFVPLMILVMMDVPDQEWGEPLYPVQY